MYITAIEKVHKTIDEEVKIEIELDDSSPKFAVCWNQFGKGERYLLRALVHTEKEAKEYQKAYPNGYKIFEVKGL